MKFLDRLFGRQPSADDLPPAEPLMTFAVGDRVRDAFGSAGVVTAVDSAAENGLGRVVVRLDDGREIRAALVASGLERETAF